MPDLSDDLKITDETVESIMARLLADTNAGIDPNDPSYSDSAPGSLWDDFNRALAIEDDRQYDRMNEIVAAVVPSLSFGSFLDQWATSLGLTRNPAALAGGTVRFTGTVGTVIMTGSQVSTAQTGQDTDPVTFRTTQGGTIPTGGSLDLLVVAVEVGSRGNVAASTVTINDSGGPAVTNPQAMTGGADVETDEALQKRIIRKLSGAGGGGNVDDYIQWALAYPGVGFVTVRPNTPSVGHVTVLITDAGNDPMPAHAISGLQALIDPSSAPAQGAGLAPVGATAHVTTPASFAVAVVASVDLEPTYSLTEAAGRQNVRADIVASLSRYIDGLPAGGDVLRNKVIAAIVDVPGVTDVTALTLNGLAAAVIAVSATQVASMTPAPTLTEV